MTVTAGLRARLITDSIRSLIEDGLDALGWFDSNRSHLPIVFHAEPPAWDQALVYNTMVLSVRSRSSTFVEVGSTFIDDSTHLGIDLYVENASLGVELANDIRDVLRGRLDPGAARATATIFDLRQPTPPEIGYVTISDVRAIRVPPEVNLAYTAHWFGVEFLVSDHYYEGDET